MDFEDLLKGALRSGMDNEDAPAPHKSQGDAKKNLDKYLDSYKDGYDFEVGDYVERNEFGRKRYKLPCDNMVAKVLYTNKANEIDGEKLREYNDGDLVDTLLVVMCAEDVPKKVWVDGSFYKKANARDNIIATKFGRKK